MQRHGRNLVAGGLELHALCFEQRSLAIDGGALPPRAVEAADFEVGRHDAVSWHRVGSGAARVGRERVFAHALADGPRAAAARGARHLAVCGHAAGRHAAYEREDLLLEGREPHVAGRAE